MSITAAERNFMITEFITPNIDHPKWDKDPRFIDYILPFIKEMGFCNEGAIKRQEIDVRARLKNESEEEKQITYSEKIKNAQIPQSFLDHYDTEYWKIGTDFSKQYFETYDKKTYPDLFISGASYHGKSRLAAEILKKFLRMGYVGLFLNLPGLREKRFEMMSDNPEQKKRASDFVGSVKSLAEKVPVLVMDDLAKRPEKEKDGVTLSFFGGIIYDIYNKRVSKNLITITTCELKKNSNLLVKRLTESVVNRIGERCISLDCGATQKYTEYKQEILKL